MKLHAYILAADLCWLEASISSYYKNVEKIIVSYDKDGIGWTGVKNVPVDKCLERLRAIDKDNKMVFSPGHYGRAGFSGMDNDSYQRCVALQEASEGADWVLTLDTDEVLPNIQALMKVLEYAEEQDIGAVEWPMRVLFRRMDDGRFLEVCSENGSERYEYPGAICVRPNVKLQHSRKTDQPFIRVVVEGDKYSLQVNRPLEIHEHRFTIKSGKDAILHNSWARSEQSVRTKISSWGHNEGLKTLLFYWLYWWPAKYRWRTMRDFHPFARNLWPALKPLEALPPFISPEDARRTG